MSDLRIIPPKLTKDEWNALLNHGLYKTANYIIRKNGSYYEAINGETGKVDYGGQNNCGGVSGTNAAAVIQAAINALTNGGVIFIKRGTYEINSTISWSTDGIAIFGEGRDNTILKATSAIDSVFDIHEARYAYFRNFWINGNNQANYGIKGERSPSSVPVHSFEVMNIWGAKKANINLTGCEDSSLRDIWLDGRIANDTSTVYTEYGLMFGREGEDGYKTGGHVKCFDVKCGFMKKGDIYAKNIVNLGFFGCLFSSKNTYSADLEAHIIVEGGTGTGAVLPELNLYNCWFENSGGSANNILVKNVKASKISIFGGIMFADSGFNIYSTLNPAAESLTIVGTHLERASGDYHIKLPCTSACLLNVKFYGGNKIDTTNVSKYLYWEVNGDIHTNVKIWTNAPIETQADIVLNGHYLQEAGRVTSNVDGNLELGVQTSGKKVNIFDWGANEWILELDKDTIDIHGSYIKGWPTASSCTEQNKMYIKIKLADGTIKRVPCYDDA